MTRERVDLRAVEVRSPESLKRLSLEMALLQNNYDISSIWAEYLEFSTSWRAIPLESLEHAVDFLAREPSHIFLTHWHIGLDHGYNNPVTQLVAGLRERRGGPGIGAGPLLIGTYRKDSSYYTNHKVEFNRFLTENYDYFMEFKAILPRDFLNTILRALWRHLV